jgi:hypothetical protein
VKDLLRQPVLKRLVPSHLVSEFHHLLFWCLFYKRLAQGLPESQVFYMFWCPIFHFAHGMPLAELVSSITEYEIIKERDTAREDFAVSFVAVSTLRSFFVKRPDIQLRQKSLRRKGFSRKTSES